MELNREQQAAADAVSNREPIIVLSGPGGTGKTTAASEMAKRAAERGLEVRCMATTNAAARRMNEDLGEAGQQATTVHRALRMRMQDGQWVCEHNRHNPIRADIVFVEESSMLVLGRLRDLLDALQPGCQIVFLGDHYQLPPVGRGYPFRDLMQSSAVTAIELTQPIRFKGEQFAVSQAIRHRKPFKLRPHHEIDIDDSGQIAMVRRTDIVSGLSQIIENLAAKGVNVGRDLQVITGTNRLKQRINDSVRQIVNPDGEPLDDRFQISVAFKDRRKNRPKDREQKKWSPISTGDRVIWTGDRTMATGPNSEPVVVVKHDFGAISEQTTRDGIVIELDSGQHVVCSDRFMSKWHLASCVTVHASQGSEWPYVVFVVGPRDSMNFDRSLAYVACTRSKKRCLVMGDEGEFLRLSRKSLHSRKTLLTERIDYEIGNQI